MKRTTVSLTMAGLAVPSRLVLRKLPHLLPHVVSPAQAQGLSRSLPSRSGSMLIVLTFLTRNQLGQYMD